MAGADLDVHLDAIAAGDASAFAAWLRGAEAPLRARLRSFASVVDTEAVLQEALLRTWQVAPRVRRDGRPNALLRLAARIARNAAIDEVRRSGRGPELSAAALEDPPDPLLPAPPDPLLRAAIEACRALLPPAPGRALTARLTAHGGRSDRALAADLDMRPNTFLKNVGRARALLARCLADRGIAWGTP